MACRQYRLPEFALFAIPNGSHKSPAAAAKFKREGLRSGIPDLFLAAPRGDRAGLFIEMKRTKGSVTSDAQREACKFLAASGYAVEVCKGWEQAKDVISDYLRER